jgi:hypothetical protein
MSTRMTHPVNVAYLVVGLVFLGISGTWGLRAADIVDTGESAWLLPLTLVAAGVIGLVAFAAKGLSRGRSADPDPDSDPWDGDAVDTDLLPNDRFDTQGEDR